MQLSVVAGQMPIVLDIAENTRQILSILEQTRPGELVVLPEGAISGYGDDLAFLAHLPTTQLADAIEMIAHAVVERRVHLVVGSCLWKEQQWWNAAIYFTPEGRRFVYHKVNLATHERSWMSAGSELPVFPLRIEQGEVSLGIQLCREIRFPEQWRYLAMQGADLFVYLTNAINTRESPNVWKSHLVSRAAENQRFLVSANVAHAEQHCPTLIIAPNGEVRAEAAPAQPALLRQTIDLRENADWYLNQCRTDMLVVDYKK